MYIVLTLADPLEVYYRLYYAYMNVYVCML